MKFKNKLLFFHIILLFLPYYVISSKNNNIVKKHFSDIILVINFNHPYYSNISFLKELYADLFDTIMFYGETEHNDVVTVTTNNGYFLSPVILDVMRRFPNAKGYLFLQDDCVLHVWNLMNLHQEKIWYAVDFNDGLTPHDFFYSVLNNNGHVSGFGWEKWNYSCGFKAAWQAYSELTDNEKVIINKNVGHNNIPANMCEVFYIPAHFKTDFMKLSTLFNNVFCEIAIPTMLCCLDSIDNWEHLIMLGGAGVGTGCPGSKMLSDYPINVSWIHPIKFSYAENQIRIKNIFDAMLKE